MEFWWTTFAIVVAMFGMIFLSVVVTEIRQAARRAALEPLAQSWDIPVPRPAFV